MTSPVLRAYLRGIAVMLLAAVPAVVVAVSIFDWLSSPHGGSYVDALINAAVMGFLVLGPWLVLASAAHTAVTRLSTGAVVSVLVGVGLGLAAGFLVVVLISARAAGENLQLLIWTGIAGALHGALVWRLARQGDASHTPQDVS